MKYCGGCGSEKSLEEFGRNKARPDGRQTQCRECKRTHDERNYRSNPTRRQSIRTNTTEQRKSNLRRVWEYLSSHPCVDCSEADPIVLEFDHVRGDKVKAVSNMVGSSCGWETIQQEIEKCEVRCANCHRRKTAQRGGWYAGLH